MEQPLLSRDQGETRYAVGQAALGVDADTPGGPPFRGDLRAPAAAVTPSASCRAFHRFRGILGDPLPGRRHRVLPGALRVRVLQAGADLDLVHDRVGWINEIL